MSAQEKVLGIPELVENIIASMAPEDIPKATRVCKMWHEQVLRSKTIRLARCLRPKYSCMKEITIPPSFNSIRTTELMPCYEFPRRPRVHRAFQSPSKGCSIRFGKRARYEVSIKGDFVALRDTPDFQAFRNQHATQPPITQILICVRGQVESSNSFSPVVEVDCIVRNEQGVTVGEVLDAAHAIHTTADWMKSSVKHDRHEACFRIWDTTRDVQRGKELYE